MATVTISKAEFWRLLGAVKRSMATPSSGRESFCGVFVQSDPFGGVWFITLDGHRLSIAGTTPQQPADFALRMLSYDFVRELKKRELPEEIDLLSLPSESHRCPNVWQFLGLPWRARIRAPRAQFLGLAKAASRALQVVFDLEGHVAACYENERWESYKLEFESIDMLGDSPPSHVLALDPRYLRSACAGLRARNVELFMIDNEYPALFRGAGESSVYQIVMPMEPKTWEPSKI